MALHLLSIALEFLTKHHISEHSTRGYEKIVTTWIENKEPGEEGGVKHKKERYIVLVVALHRVLYLMHTCPPNLPSKKDLEEDF